MGEEGGHLAEPGLPSERPREGVLAGDKGGSLFPLPPSLNEVSWPPVGSSLWGNPGSGRVTAGPSKIQSGRLNFQAPGSCRGVAQRGEGPRSH